jgi:hypothetical protein
MSPDPEMQTDPVALEIDLVQLDLAVLFAPGLHGQHLGVSWKPLQRGKQVPYGHPPRVATAPSSVLRSREKGHRGPDQVRQRREWPPRTGLNETPPRERRSRTRLSETIG